MVGALQLAKNSKETTVKCLKKVNYLIRKAESKESVVVFAPISNEEDIIIHGIGDASYSCGDKAVGGQVILLGNAKTRKVSPIYWKSKLIKQVCNSPKYAETRNLVKTVDIARFMGDQVSQLL